MNPYRAYQQHSTPAWTRIDMLLAIVDGVIDRLERALLALKQKDEPTAQQLLGRTHVLVLELAAGINLDIEDPSSINLLRLYEFVAHSIAKKDLLKIQASVGVMRQLREGFGAIREQAVALERSGAVPPIGPPLMVLESV